MKASVFGLFLSDRAPRGLSDSFPRSPVRQSRGLVGQYFVLWCPTQQSPGLCQSDKKVRGPFVFALRACGQLLESFCALFSESQSSILRAVRRAEGQKWLHDFRARTPEAARPSPYRSSAQRALGFGKTH